MTEETKENSGLKFNITVTPEGFGVETNMSTAEAAFWLGVLHVQYSMDLISQNKPA